VGEFIRIIHNTGAEVEPGNGNSRHHGAKHEFIGTEAQAHSDQHKKSGTAIIRHVAERVAIHIFQAEWYGAIPEDNNAAEN
jgi:hypothetical protein